VGERVGGYRGGRVVASGTTTRVKYYELLS